MSARTWRSGASRRCRSWPRWPRLYFSPPLKTGGLPNVYNEYWEKPIPLTKERFYGYVLRALHEQGYALPDRKTVNRYMTTFETTDTHRKRLGRVGAYDKRQFSAHEQALEPHGTRILEIVHIDHKLQRVCLRCSTTGILLGLCWITLAVDAFSRMIVGFWIDFERPSVVSVMMVLRDIVRRFGRLPTCVVTDNGAEFHSTLLQILLAKHGAHELYRAPRHASDGGVLEREFRTIDNDLINCLEGVVAKGRDLRKYDPFTDPRVRAKHTVGSLYDHLETYLFSTYPDLYHSGLACSPRRIWDRSAEQSGVLELPGIPYDWNFYFDTLPFDVSRPTRQIRSSGEISFRNLSYQNSRFSDPELHGVNVPVRYDPPYPGAVYAQLGRAWVKCSLARGGHVNRSASGHSMWGVELHRRYSLREQFRPARAAELARMHAAFVDDLIPIAKETPAEGDGQQLNAGRFTDIDFTRLQEGQIWTLPKT